MKKKIFDADMPIGKLTRMPDDLPSPAELAKSMRMVPVDLILDKPIINFFKKQAKRHHVQYRQMISEVLAQYTKRSQAI